MVTSALGPISCRFPEHACNPSPIAVNFRMHLSALRFGHGGSTSFRLQHVLAGIQHAIGLSFHTVDEAAIVVLDTLGKVDVTSELLAVDGAEEGAEDGNLTATLDREGDVLSRVREVCSMSELWSL